MSQASTFLPGLLSGLLLLVNLAVARRLISVEFTQHMNSNEGSFMAISRFLIERWPHGDWFPFWFNGMPFPNSYTPGLHILNALVAVLARTSTAHAFHFVTAAFYMVGPVLLFWMAWRMSGYLYTAFFASLLYSLFSPSAIFPAVRGDLGSWFHPRRLHTLVHYGEGPHNVALALLPLAILLAWWVIERGRFRDYIALGFVFAIMVLTNAFAAVDLALVVVILAVIQPAGNRSGVLARLSAAAVVSYLWISPLLPPSLIQTVRANSPMVGGDYRMTSKTFALDAFIVLGFVLMWYATRRLSNPFERFAALFAYVFFVIPASAHFAHTPLLPQAERYHLEMEMGLCLAAIFAANRLLRLAPPRLALVLSGVLIGLMLAQLISYRAFARDLIDTIDIKGTIEYKTARWLDTNLHGLRVMASDDAGTWLNVFTDQPQLSSGHDPFSPNWVVQIVVYGIYYIKDAEHTVPWLKAFGCHAITVPGSNSRMTYKPFQNPNKFAGVLPLLWRDEDDSIYAVPQRTRSLAHVVPEAAIVQHQPENALDVGEVDRFVAALDDVSLPEASYENGRIVTTVRAGQVIALQMTYVPGWTATNAGRPVPITKDGLGLITLHPKCDGPCDVTLEYTGGLEQTACRWLSALVTLAVLGVLVWRRRTTQ